MGVSFVGVFIFVFSSFVVRDLVNLVCLMSDLSLCQ